MKLGNRLQVIYANNQVGLICLTILAILQKNKAATSYKSVCFLLFIILVYLF